MPFRSFSAVLLAHDVTWEARRVPDPDVACRSCPRSEELILADEAVDMTDASLRRVPNKHYPTSGEVACDASVTGPLRRRGYGTHDSPTRGLLGWLGLVAGGWAGLV